MAGGFITTTEAAGNHPGKMTSYVFFACLVAGSGGLIFGYDIGISGNQ